MSDVTHALDLGDHATASSLESLQNNLTFDTDHPLHDRYHVDTDERKHVDLQDTLQLPGMHPHTTQEQYYTQDALPYSIPLGLQFQYLNSQTLIPTLGIGDVPHYHHHEHLLQIQQQLGAIPEYHDPAPTPTVTHTPQSRAPKPPRKSRWRPTPKQKERLESFWMEDQYPDRKKKQSIAQELEAVSAEQVSRWFKHRRESLAQKGQFAYRSEAAAKFSNDQVITLEQVFKSNAYPSREDIKLISEQMLVSQQRVKNWFKARRCRLAQKGEFEFRQSDSVQVRPMRPLTGERLKRSKDDITCALEPNAKRQELMPSIDTIVDVVDANSHHHHHQQHHQHHHHQHQHHQHHQHHQDLPQISSLVPDVDMSNSLHGPLVDHIMPKSVHDPEDVDHVFHTQANHHLLHDDRVDSIKVESLHHLTDDVT